MAWIQSSKPRNFYGPFVINILVETVFNTVALTPGLQTQNNSIILANSYLNLKKHVSELELTLQLEKNCSSSLKAKLKIEKWSEIFFLTNRVN